MEPLSIETDYLVIGAGIIGLTLARELKQRYPQSRITVIEKEDQVARHGSGRNSGVLHAGFYYTADSLKARFTRDGNRMMQAYVDEKGLAINRCHKLVVATSEEQQQGIHELKRRGDHNGVAVQIVDQHEAAAIDPNARTIGCALYSPTTATVDPGQVCRQLFNDLVALGVRFHFSHGYAARIDDHTIRTRGGMTIATQTIINAAGLYADTIAKDFGVGEQYTIIPFKGIYLKYHGTNPPARTNIYPVPNLKNPFLGVHYTVTVDGTVKIGPTAIPAFWRENYGGLAHFSFRELSEIIGWESRLYLEDAFGFRSLALDELRKYRRSHFVGLAASMVHQLDRDGFDQWSTPGIRAQLLDTTTRELVMDFVVKKGGASIHILNAVSPAFTCSMPFAAWVVETYLPS